MKELPKSRKKRRYWIIFILSILILVDIICYFTFNWFNQNVAMSLSLLSGLVVALITTILRWVEEGKLREK